MVIEREHIPDTDTLFCRVPQVFKSPKLYISRSVFAKQNQSVDWEKYAKEEDTVARARKPHEIIGILRIKAGKCRELGQAVEHRPELDNRSHSQIEGAKDSEIQAKLRDNSEFWRNPNFAGDLPKDFPVKE